MEAAYLDYAASNPVDPRVREAVIFALDAVGNPSSPHARGRVLREAVDSARESVAGLLSVEPRLITFCSGATEANNLALRGYFARLRETVPPDRPLKLIVSEVEHSSVREAAQRVSADFGVRVERLPVDDGGVVRIDELERMVDGDTAMVCVMWANNVIGSLQPIRDIAGVVRRERDRREDGGLPLSFMSDAVQAMRTEEVRPAEEGVDILTLSGHKIYGPKGIGVLYAGAGVDLAPQVVGGGQERGLRGGTENVPGIVGIGRASDILTKERQADRGRVARLHARLADGLRALRGVTVIGDAGRTVPGICYFSVAGESGDVLTLKLDAAGIAASSGSACDSGTRKSTVVLQAVRSGQAMKRGGVRVSFGRFSAERDIDNFLSVSESIIRG